MTTAWRQTFKLSNPRTCHKEFKFSMNCFIFALIFVCLFSIATSDNPKPLEDKDQYHNLWAVHVDGGDAVADKIAVENGFINKGRIGALRDMYHFVADNKFRRDLNPNRHASEHTHRLLQTKGVKWAQQQKLLIRKRRYPMDNHIRDSDTISSSLSQNNSAVFANEMQYFERHSRSFDENSYAKTINDPKFKDQWHLYQASSRNHLNVLPAWSDGITGKGVVVTIVDDGIDYTHPDLKDNYDPKASTDINGGDDDPFPDVSHPINKHGTRCSGQVAASRNHVCGVGVAYESRIGGIRMLDGPVTDSVEAHSLSLNPQHVHVYSNSWGPTDDGRTMEGPAPLASQAIFDGITQGRGGKGSIYIFASGNGGPSDDCNCDGYTNSPFTLSIGAIDEFNKEPYYTERCASTLAVTYSSGSFSRSITTVDLHHGCTSSHSGTSAAAPLAAGIVALMLQANPNLTWRDVQHIILRGTWNPSSISWDTNKAGFKMHYAFGFGIIDAKKVVDLARTWKNRPPQKYSFHPISPEKGIPAKSKQISDARLVKIDISKTDTEVEELEHVQLQVILDAPKRGDIQIDMEAPSGTWSMMLSKRANDYSSRGIQWTFMTVRHWGESPIGTWKIYVRNSNSQQGHLRFAKLILFGTAASGDHKPISCAKGTYLADEECHSCHNECGNKGCTGAGPSNCINCQHYENDGVCILDCSDIGMLNDPEEKECIPCNPLCAGCIGKSEFDCIQCKSFSIVDGNQQQCVKSCPSNFYTTDSKECKPCHPQCNDCTGPSDRDCLSCQNVQLQDGQCVTSCPKGTYRTGDTCSECDHQCKGGCHGEGPTRCTACKGLRLQVQQSPDHPVQTKCVEECPSNRIPDEHQVCVCRNGTYADHISTQCFSCHSECLEACTGPTVHDCIGRCSHLQHQSECVRECPTNFFETTDTASFHELYPDTQIRSMHVCMPCNGQCAQACSGPTAYDCLPDTPVSQRCLAYEEEGSCVEECNEGWYPHLETFICYRCDVECQGCLGDGPEECLQCKNMRLGSVCVGSCPAMTYTTANKVCKDCHKECADVCFGPSDRQCYANASAAATIDPSCRTARLGHQCVSECPRGFFQDEAFTCRPCSSECGDDGCTGPDTVDCRNCKFAISHNGTCVKGCEPKQYLSETQLCMPCHSSCSNGCIGPSLSDCVETSPCQGIEPTSCASNMYFDFITCQCVEVPCGSGLFYNDACVPSCPAGTYEDAFTRTCLQCYEGCDTCTGPHMKNCTSCIFAGSIDESNILTCYKNDTCPFPDEQFFDSSSNLCRKCHEQCIGCYGETDRDCKECLNVKLQGQCLSTCPSGFFLPLRVKGMQRKMCQPCDAECKDGCDGPTSSHCSECKHVRLGSSCVTSCPQSMYADLTTGQCNECSQECVEGCTGPSPSNCLGVRCSGFRMGNECVSECPQGFFGTGNGLCESCSPVCNYGCVDGTSEGCVTAIITSASTTTKIFPQETTYVTSKAIQSTSTGDTTESSMNSPEQHQQDEERKGRIATSSAEIAVASICAAILMTVILAAIFRFKKKRQDEIRVTYKHLQIDDWHSDGSDYEEDDFLDTIGFDIISNVRKGKHKTKGTASEMTVNLLSIPLETQQNNFVISDNQDK